MLKSKLTKRFSRMVVQNKHTYEIVVSLKNIECMKMPESLDFVDLAVVW